MKFQCGKCSKNYLIDNTDTINKLLTLACTKCDNNFFIRENLSFYSSSGDSKIICENCGQLVEEKSKACPSCNLLLDKQHEEQRIDNKEYEKVVVQEGKAQQKKTAGKKGGKGGKLLFLLIVLLALGGGFWFISQNQDKLQDSVLQPILDLIPKLSQKQETQVVLMKSGKTYYAEKIEHKGSSVLITTKNGLVITVDEKDILQIAKAVLEE
ncbi:MAG: hypothetical protein D3923_12620 [Candidatus Electrothrix sp. AR3]|nr:hypothetical protein [Candidatus Electrothrix sp. AR3]